MTRISLLPPVQMTDQHLIAETAQEIIRIPILVRNRISNGVRFNDLPKLFTLNTGHCKFFFDKAMYIINRYNDLHWECQKRGFKVKYINGLYPEFMPKKLQQDYTPTDEAIQLIKERIASNIRKSNQVPRYYRKDIDKEYYIKNILKL